MSYNEETMAFNLAQTQAPQAINPQGPGVPVVLTQSAVDQVSTFLQKNPKNQGKYFRVSVEGGGCSGYQYGFSFDEKRAEDLVIPCGGVDILLDPQSRLYLHGSTVDYVNDLNQAGFVVQNPNAKGTCGCGVSFTV